MPTMQRSREDLEKARNVVQAAHDYVEIFGFDIRTIGPSAMPWEGSGDITKRELAEVAAGNIRSLHQSGTRLVPACFIGAARLGAGVDPGGYTVRTDHGDGEELTVALELMDREALKSLNEIAESEEQLAELTHEVAARREGDDEPGRLAEAVGFALRENDDPKLSDLSEKHALGVFRAVLTSLHEEIEQASQ